MKTLSELQALSDAELRVMLANILFPDFPTYWSGDCLRHRYPKGATGPAFNYPADLNAVAEVEKGQLINSSLVLSYDATLKQVCFSGARTSDFGARQSDFIWSASARQRTIALILTLQK